MNRERSAFATFVYVIIGLLALIIVFQIICAVIRVVSWLASLILSGVLLLVIIYLIYLLAKWAAKSIQ